MTRTDATERFRADPRTWPRFRRTRFTLRLCFVLMLLATMLFIPSAWIILAPADPLLRPDLFTTAAWGVLGFCALVMYLASRMNRSTRETYASAVHELVEGTRVAAGDMGVTLDVEIGPAFPNLLISRRHRLLGVAAPTPIFVKFDDINAIKVAEHTQRSIWDRLSPNNAVIHIVLKQPTESIIVSMGGNGLSRVTADETFFVANKLNEYVFPPPSWRPAIGEGLQPETLDYIKNLRLT